MIATNPLADTLRFERRVPECAIVIFGANGDLTKRKLLPALYRLAYERRLPASFAIVGNSRTRMSDDQFRSKMHDEVQQFLEDSPFDEDLWADFARNLSYIAGDLKDLGLYSEISQKLDELRQKNTLFYLSTQPSYYEPIIELLGQSKLALPNGGASGRDAWRRIVIEKPFGHDLASAQQLNHAIHSVVPEQEVYRIDHYLGKETVQNILAFRFGNGIFEPLWNRRYIDHVQITAAESIGVEGRGAYYQEAGALRDMIQNHLLQVTATVAMEPSAAFEPDAVRDERAKLLRSIKIMTPDQVPLYAVPGQYRGFRQEPGVDPQSQTDTFAAVTFYIDNWRWAGVPFYIRTGKKLPKRVTDIAIQFKDAPHALFTPQDGGVVTQPNLLILRIQPEEGISLRFLSKQPGSGMRLRPVSMDFNYGASFGERSPTAYETLLVDAMVGDATLYTRQDMVEASWRVVEPILDYWDSRKFDFPNYEPGVWGPSAADEMLARNGHHWRNS
ncbi:MAG TPA: glucose-6-phosphate dehydrogenase [Bryobacteraceae bacterium]|nr:glucose-6-phosphate dehydrogenase [Bryobacteraceae bacterium]